MASSLRARCKLLNFCLRVNVLRCRYVSSSRVVDVYSDSQVGEQMKIQGWIKAVRKMKGYIFFDVDDGSCAKRLQVVMPRETVPSDLTYGSSVEVSGCLAVNSNSQLELRGKDVEVLGPCVVTDGYPFAPRKYYSPDYVRQFIHLRPRTHSFSSLLRLRHKLTLALHEYFDKEGFINVHTPILTSNDCEGAGEAFAVKPENENLINELLKPGMSSDEAFFNDKAFLTVSGQLHLEAVARALNRVYCFGPTFRAENSKSRLHLSEFYMLEAEVAFTTGLNDIILLIQNLIQTVTKQILDKSIEDIHMYRKLQGLENVDGDLKNITDVPFSVESYDKVCDILEKSESKLQKPHIRGENLSKEHELFLVKYNNGVPIFVVEWPKDIKPFYMKLSPDNPTKVLSLDLLCSNVGELCGGSLREDCFKTLQEKLTNAGLENKLDWYLELRKFGNVTTGGFGMGFERYLQVILGTSNIKDTIPFPRWPHNCKL